MRTMFEKIDRLREKITASRPFDVHMLKAVRDYYRIGLTYTSNALEGNALTETETKVVLEEGLTYGIAEFSC